jgi:hypothetical protein
MKRPRKPRAGRPRRKARLRIITSWKKAQAQLKRWRSVTANLSVELKRPRVIDVVPIDFLRGEPVEQAGEPTSKFRGRLIFYTTADITIRRPSGAVLVIDLYEIAALYDTRTRIQPVA